MLENRTYKGVYNVYVDVPWLQEVKNMDGTSVDGLRAMGLGDVYDADNTNFSWQWLVEITQINLYGVINANNTSS